LAPVYAAARLLADSVASLPLQAYRDTGDARTKIATPSLFASPAASGTLFDWLYALMSSLVLQGNAYGLVVARDGFGFATMIEWLAPSCVRVDDSGPRVRYFYEGRELPVEDVFHVRGFVLPGSVEGVSPVRYFATMIGAGLSAEKYSADWFDNGGIPPGTFKNSGMTITPTQADEITSRLVNKIRTRKPLVYGQDWDYNALSLPPGEVQFIESMQLTATQIAAIYGIPPERIGGVRGSSLTYATQEQEEIAFITSTLRPWLIRLEQAFFRILPERVYVRFNVDAMLRVDAMTRRRIYQIDRQIGLRNIDELRALEELPPLPDGRGQDYEPLAVVIADSAVDDVQPTQPPVRLVKGQP
jgi:HK97 family phage portal protein